MIGKLLRLAVGASVVATGAHAADTCSAVSFASTSATTFISSLNTVIDVAKSVIPTYLASYDPLVITNKSLAVQTISVLGYTFEITPVLSKLNVTGITTIVPRHINVTSNDSVDIGADFDGTLTAVGTLDLVIAQTNHQWYQICWTDVLHPTTCPSITVAMDFALGVVDLSLVSDTIADLVSCPTTTTSTTCSDITVTQILVAALSGSYTAILDRILLRFKDLSVSSLTLSFASISALSFNFESSSTLLTSISNTLLTYTKDAINKKGDVYNTAIALAQSLIKSLLNDVIEDDLEPLFGDTCYDS